MNKVILFIGAIFLPLGLIFAGVGLWAYFDDKALADAGLRAGGTVVELSRSRDSEGSVSFRPVVAFRDARGIEHQFVGSLGSNSSRHSIGETVGVIYDPDAPGRARIDGFMDRFFLPLMFGGIGSIFALVGAGMLAAYFRRRKIVAELKARGLPIEADFLECYLDTRTKMNGRSPWRVACQAVHPATGKLQRFESDPIWVDPSERIGKDGKIRVLVDPGRPKHHFVDLGQWVGEEARA